MDRITKSLLEDFSQEQLFTTHNIEERFELFGTYCCVRSIFHEEFDPSELSVGGGEDTGIDSIAIVINGVLMNDIDEIQEFIERTSQIDVTFVFIQTTTSESFNSAKIGSFIFGVEDFFADSPKLAGNEFIDQKRKIMEFIFQNSKKFRGKNPVCRLYYISSGTFQSDKNLEARRNAAYESLKSTNLFRSVSFEYIGASHLQRLFNAANSSISKTFDFQNKATIPPASGFEQAYIGFIPAKTFLDIITDENGDIIKYLFYENVRDWLGNNPINAGIEATLDSEARARFVIMNNGVTIICRKLYVSANNVTLEDFSVVNGCQTSHSLFHKRDNIDDQTLVPIRIVSTQDENVVSEIVQATNRQNKVDPSQFFSLSDIAKRIEAYFLTFDGDKKIFYERRSNQYSGSGVEKVRIINQKTLLNSFAAMFLKEAHSTTRNHRSLEERVGKDILKAGDKEIWYYTSAFAFYRLEFLFRNGRLQSVYKPARYHIMQAFVNIFGSGARPQLNANASEKYCNQLLKVLWDVDQAESAFVESAKVVAKVADGNWHRDHVRSKSFTDKIEKATL